MTAQEIREKLSYYLPRSLHRKAKVLAAAEGVSLSLLVEQAIADYVARRDGSGEDE